MTDTAAAAPAPATGTSAPPASGSSLDAVYANMQREKTEAAEAAQPSEVQDEAEDATTADTPADDAADSGSEVEDTGSDELQDEQPEEAEETEEQPEEQLYTVKVDGQQLEVTLDELVNSYQLGKASRARMDQAAQQKRAAEEQLKEVESRKAEIAQAREAYEAQAQRYATVVDKLASNLEPEAKRWDSVDWDALDAEDPVRAASEYAKYQRFLERQNAVQAEQARVERERHQEMSKRLDEARTHLRTEIQTLFPQWSDPAVQQRDLDDMTAYAREIGIQDKELQNWLRGRDWKILHDATLYRRATKARAAAKEPVPTQKATAPQIVRKVSPEGVRANPVRTARATEVAGLQQQARKSGTVADIFKLMQAQSQNKSGRR